MPWFKSGCVSLFLSLSLSSCASSPTVTVQSVCPPQALLQQRPSVPWTGTTNGDLLDWAALMAERMGEHNADKQAASQFCKEAR